MKGGREGQMQQIASQTRQTLSLCPAHAAKRQGQSESNTHDLMPDLCE